MSGTHMGETRRTVQKVHLAPLWSVAGGAVGLVALATTEGLSTFGWIAGLLYLGVSNALLTRGLRRRGRDAVRAGEHRHRGTFDPRRTGQRHSWRPR